MAADILLKLDGIKGESKIKDMADYIDVLSFSWGASNAASVHFGGGGGTAKGDTHDLVIHKRIDTASQDFFLKTMLGQHYKNAILVCRLASGDKPVEYFKLEMDHVFVTSWNPSCSGDQHGMESVSLSFKKVKVTYTGQKDDGSKDSPKAITFNIVTHAKNSGGINQAVQNDKSLSVLGGSIAF